MTRLFAPFALFVLLGMLLVGCAPGEVHDTWMPEYEEVEALTPGTVAEPLYWDPGDSIDEAYPSTDESMGSGPRTPWADGQGDVIFHEDDPCYIWLYGDADERRLLSARLVMDCRRRYERAQGLIDHGEPTPLDGPGGVEPDPE